MNLKAQTKEERLKRKRRPPYPKTRRVGIIDALTSREFWLAIYFFALFQAAMYVIAISVTKDNPDIWVYGGTGIALFTFINAIWVAKKRQAVKFRADYVHFGRIIAVIILLYTTIMIVSTLFNVFKLSIPEQANQASLNTLLNSHFAPMTFIVVLVAPTVEELVFREYLPHAFGPSQLSFGIASLIFALLHGPTGIIGWLLYSIMSIAFLILRLKGNNIFEAILGHVIYNGLTIILSFI